jgi:hypothetical protein
VLLVLKEQQARRVPALQAQLVLREQLDYWVMMVRLELRADQALLELREK